MLPEMPRPRASSLTGRRELGERWPKLITQNAWAKITQELAAPAAHRRLPTGAGDE
jgi:hypothetical protein